MEYYWYAGIGANLPDVRIYIMLCLNTQQGILLKQGQLGPQKLSSIESLKIKKNTQRYRVFSLLQPWEMASLSNSRWQNRTERPNRFTDNVNIIWTAKRYVVYEWVSLWVTP